MDVSLDDYINKTNFKVKIGNADANTGGHQPIKRRLGGSFQGSKVADVSITVPADRKTGTNAGKTNQVRDARERLVGKAKPIDAREKLNMKVQLQQNTDARQKLMNIRARKVQGPTDARMKIEAKKQVQGPGSAGAATETFSLTRTVNNKSGVQMTSGPPGNMQITRTLTKVMPAGYESLLGPTTSNATQSSHTSAPAPPSVKTRLGPSQGPAKNPVINLTRTVSNTPAHTVPQRPVSSQYPPPIPQQPQIVHQYSPHPGGPQFHPPPAPAPAPGYYPQNPAPPPPHPAVYGGPPAPYGSPTHYLPISHQAPPTQAPPPPIMHHQVAAPPAVPPYPIEEPGQRTMVRMQPPPAMGQAPPSPMDGPPYPVGDNLPITRTVGQEVPQVSSKPPMPIIQVRNDQYRPPASEPTYQQYMASSSQQYSPQEPEFRYSHPQQHQYQQSSYSQPAVQRTGDRPASSQNVVKTIVNDVPSQSVRQTSSTKRKAESSGPLRLSNTNTTPIIDLPGGGARGSTRQSSNTYSRSLVDEPAVKRAKQEVPDGSEIISPLQGYKVAISNLHVTVTQDDIIELFGAMGAVKKVRVLKPGSAEVVYVKQESATEAVKTYHERELDGQPMVVKMITSASAQVKEVPETPPASMKPVTTGPLKFSKKPAGMSRVPERKGVEVDVLHKALFKTSSSAPSKPVTFTVNI